MTCASLPVPWVFSSLAVACTAQSTLTHSRRFSIHGAQHPDGPDDLVPDRLPSVTILIWLIDRVHSTPSPSSSSSAAAFLETSHFPTTKPPFPPPSHFTNRSRASRKTNRAGGESEKGNR
ncbi:unnamed protein product [Musa acuminata var. zebrina]